MKVYSKLIRDMAKEPTAIETLLDLFLFLGQIEWNISNNQRSLFTVILIQSFK